MNPGAKLGLYGLVLVAVLGVGAAVGGVVGPIDTSGDDEAHPTHEAEEDAVRAPDLPAGGLLVSEDGYTFAPEGRTLDGATFAFRITGPDGAPVTRYDELHDRRLHLIIASRDLQHYAHVHPTLSDDGRWSVAVPALPAGAYRAFADFRPTGGRQHTLGIDLSVPGSAEAAAALEPSSRDEVAGFQVELEADPAGDTATVTVRRDGQVVTTQPYLGAAGHLVALRDGDLAYLHVHPLDEGPTGPVAFAVEYPSDGRYALFFDFQVEGQVHTARFVVDTGPAPTPTDAHHDDGHGH